MSDEPILGLGLNIFSPAVWLFTAIFFFGVLVGKASMGWSPAWLERLIARRRAREEKRKSDHMREVSRKGHEQALEREAKRKQESA